MYIIKFFEKLKQQLYQFIILIREANELVKLSNNSDGKLDTSIKLLLDYKKFYPTQKISEIRFLTEIVKDNKFKIICEIGSLNGGSLFLFCQVAPENSLLISIDICYPFARKIANKKFARKGQKVITIKGNTQDFQTENKVKKILNGREIDLLFIDGDHSLFGVINDYVRFSPMVREGGIIAFHDIQPDSFMSTGIRTKTYVGGVPNFWSALKRWGLCTEEMIEDPKQDGCGIGLIYKK